MQRRTRTATMAPTSAVESPVVQNSSSFSICQSFRSSRSHCIRTASRSSTLLPWFLMKLNNGLDSQVQLYGFLPVDGDCVVLMRVTMMKNSEMMRNYPPNLSFSPWSLISWSKKLTSAWVMLYDFTGRMTLLGDI